MRRFLAVLAFAALALSVSAATSATQYGFTWTWVEDRQVGQYVNGDYWVVGPITITSITPASVYSAGTAATVTISAANPCVITYTGSNLGENFPFKLTTTGTLPAPLQPNVTYYAINTTTNTMNVAAAPNRAAISTSGGGGSGTHTFTRGRTTNGSMVNPVCGTAASQAADSAAGGNLVWFWYAQVNAGRPGEQDLGVGNPLTLNPGDSLISFKSIAATVQLPQLSDAAVLTCVASAPAATAFRPNYQGSTKFNYDTSQLDYSIFQSLPSSGMSAPTLASLVTTFTRPWVEINTNWYARYIHPTNNQPDYGQAMAQNTASAILSLNLDYTNAQKEALYIRILQYGIDIYGAAVAGGNWVADGCHNPGRKAVLTTTYLTFKDAGMLTYVNTANTRRFQEDLNKWYVDNNDVATVTISNASPAVVTWTGSNKAANSKVSFTTTGTLPSPLLPATEYFVSATGLTANSFSVSSTSGGARINTTTNGTGTFTCARVMDHTENPPRPRLPYPISSIGIPEWGEKHFSTPTRDASNWTDAFYRDQNGSCDVGTALAMILTYGAYVNWNNQVMFDYADRYYPNRITQTGNSVPAFHSNMYRAYRRYGPDPVKTGQSIPSGQLVTP